MTSTGLNQKDIDLINSVFSRFPEVERVILYGSRATGTFRPASDIDLTLIGENVDLTQLQAIELELDDLMLPNKFDLSLFQRISNQELREHIYRVGKVFYQR